MAFLYDGLNPQQELIGGTVTATYLSGVAVDQEFTRTDALGTISYLTDAIRSTLALTDVNGAIQTQYAYEPFGNLQVSGATTANALAFTGREADGTGLYYYRARYYSPRFQRFISSDPLGFAGGDLDTYVYAGNSPAVFSDPLGLDGGRPGYGMAGGAGPLADRPPGIPPNRGPGAGNGTLPPPPPPCGGAPYVNGGFGLIGGGTPGWFGGELYGIIGYDGQDGWFVGFIAGGFVGPGMVGYERIWIPGEGWISLGGPIGVADGEGVVPGGVGFGAFSGPNNEWGLYGEFGLLGGGWYRRCQ